MRLKRPSRRRSIPRRLGSLRCAVVTRQSKVYYVLGEVNAPGAYQLSGRETVLDAVLAAGGLTARASREQYHLGSPDRSRFMPKSIAGLLERDCPAWRHFHQLSDDRRRPYLCAGAHLLGRLLPQAAMPLRDAAADGLPHPRGVLRRRYRRGRRLTGFHTERTLGSPSARGQAVAAKLCRQFAPFIRPDTRSVSQSYSAARPCRSLRRRGRRGSSPGRPAVGEPASDHALC